MSELIIFPGLQRRQGLTRSTRSQQEGQESAWSASEDALTKCAGHPELIFASRNSWWRRRVLGARVSLWDVRRAASAPAAVVEGRLPSRECVRQCPSHVQPRHLDGGHHLGPLAPQPQTPLQVEPADAGSGEAQEEAAAQRQHFARLHPQHHQTVHAQLGTHFDW